MPIQFYQKNQGFGDLARALVSAPALYGQAKRQGQQQATDRAQDVAGIQKSIADAHKTNLEAQQLEDQRRYRAGLPEDLDVLNAYQTDRQRPVAPPPVGSAATPLEGDVNASVRGNQDLFASTAVPGADDAMTSLANVLRAYGGNAEQVTSAMMQGSLGSEAAREARGSFDGGELVAALEAIATGQNVPQLYDVNSQGIQSQRYSPGIDESGQLAQANIASERALADQRMTDEGTSLMQHARAAGLEPGTPEYEAFIRENAVKSGVTVNTGPTGAGDMQEEQGKRLGQFLGDTFIEMQEQAREAAQQNAQLDAIEQLLEGVHTGRGMPTLTEIQGLANTFGIELGSDLGQKEAARSIANQIALRFRSPESGMGLPGATSDRDLAFLQSFPPGIGQSPEGRAMITETFRRINTRKQQVAQAALELVQRNAAQGVNGLTFEDVGTLQNLWAEPMFDDEFVQRVQGFEGGPVEPSSGVGPAEYAGQPQQREPVRIQTQDDYDNLDPGDLYIDPGDNKPYMKP